MKKRWLVHRPALEAMGCTQLEPAPILNQEMPVEVMSDFDTVLLFGKLAEASPVYLKIERMLDACAPILDKGSIVLVRGYDAQMEPVILRTVVVSASGLGCTVENLERIYHKTQRKLVRYPVCPPNIIYVSDDRALERTQPCQLLNISQGGACIVLERLYGLEQSLHIRMGAAEDSAAYPCQIVRVTPRWRGFFEYGLEFAHLNRDLRGHLTREIRAIQEETRRKLLIL